MDQPGKVANPTRGQLNRENNIPLSHSGLIKKNNREKVRVYSTEHNASWGYFFKLIRGVFFLGVLLTRFIFPRSRNISEI